MAVNTFTYDNISAALASISNTNLNPLQRGLARSQLINDTVFRIYAEDKNYLENDYISGTLYLLIILFSNSPQTLRNLLTALKETLKVSPRFFFKYYLTAGIAYSTISKPNDLPTYGGNDTGTTTNVEANIIPQIYFYNNNIETYPAESSSSNPSTSSEGPFVGDTYAGGVPLTQTASFQDSKLYKFDAWDCIQISETLFYT